MAANLAINISHPRGGPGLRTVPLAGQR